MADEVKTAAEDGVSDMAVVGAIGGASMAAGATMGTITLLTTTAPAWGPLGWIGLTTTTVVAAPAAGIVAVMGLVGFGLYKGWRLASGR